ncbi:MAG TPA: DsrE family protein [Acidiferrobacterales bacterium]|nr:DsrE family protein [Acidiferrobacterales bacterium]
MKLGILLNTARHLEDVAGITRAALAKNHQVIIFTMDEGTRLLENQTLVSLAGLEGVSLSVCDHSAKMHGVKAEGLPPKIVCGSQLHNAMMNHNADRVIVL